MKKIIFTIFLFSLVLGCSESTDKNASGPSSEKISEVSKECKEFIEKNMASSDETEIFDTWIKKGKIVVQIGYKRKGDDAYIERLCIYDEENRTLSSPSQLNTSEWRK